MKKLSKIFLILTIILAFSLNLTVFAVESDNKSNQNNSQSSSSSDKNTNDEKDEKENKDDKSENQEQTSTTTSSENNQPTNESNSVKVSYDNSQNQSQVFDNVLNILLIATGIVLILLAIAIFIKIK